MLKKINKNLFQKTSFYFSQRGINRKPYNLKEGDVINEFKLLEIKDYPDFKIKSFFLKHNITGSEFLHLDTSDQNNCFSIVFKTFPFDDKGTPHILEHLVTCGSKKFPVRDPFMRMQRRSLNSYMNAWTGPDFTAYPFSSQNEKDFNNLLDLYSNLCFEPLLNYYDFLQEGWRYEIIQKEKEELNFKGVVFNEMKGNYNGSHGIFLRNITRYLYPDSAYAFDYGGYPEDITKLSYDQLKHFFGIYYHPSNMKFFSYGDLDFTKHLKFIQTNYLNKYTSSDKKIEINNVKKFNQPKEVTIDGPSDPFNIEKDKDGKLGMIYLCNDITEDYLTTFGLNILSYMLFETPNSPFYKNLIETGIAPSFCPGYGYDSSYKEALFVVGVQNINANSKEEIQKIEDKINETFKKIANEGIDKNLIDGTLHQIEVNSKIFGNNFGISLLGKMLTNFNLGTDPKKFLEVNENLKKIKKLINDGKYFENLIEKYFIQNKHHLKIVMKTDENYTNKELEKEKNNLQKIMSELTEDQKNKIKLDTIGLKKHQEEVEVKDDVLPCLELTDIAKTIEKTSYHKEMVNDVPVRLYDQPTNGLTFLRVKFELNDMTPYIRQYLNMFNMLLPRLGTSKKSYNEMSDQLNLYTTNLGLSYFSYSDYENVTKNEQSILVNIASLDQNTDKMFDLLAELLIDPKFKDSKHIMNLLKNFSSEKSAALTENAMKYALSYSASNLRQSEQFIDSLKNTRFLCNLTSNLIKSPFIKEYIEDLDFHFNDILTFLLNKNRISFSVHSDSKNFTNINKNISKFLNSLKEKNGLLFDKPINPLPDYKSEQDFRDEFVPDYSKKFFTIPGQVNYVVETIETVNMNHSDFSKLHLLSDLMENTVLHSEIREKGGAYGSGCKKSNNGYMSFYSYRDPRNIETYDAFRTAVKFVEQGKFSEQDIKEAKLKLFSHLDREKSPQDKGLSDFIYGITDERIEEYRQNILKINKDDLINVTKQYLSKKLEIQETSQVIFGSEAKDNDENLKKLKWTFEKPIEGIEEKSQN